MSPTVVCARSIRLQVMAKIGANVHLNSNGNGNSDCSRIPSQGFLVARGKMNLSILPPHYILDLCTVRLPRNPELR